MNQKNTLMPLVIVCLMILISFAVLAVPTSSEEPIPSTNDDQWVKQGVVMDTGSFPLGVQYTCVIYDEGIYKMWYAGMYAPTTAEIFYATSPDGYSWTEQGCAMPIPAGMNYAVAPNVLKEDDGTYKMWFSCQDYAWKARTYLATSTDGISWVNQGIAIDIGAPGSPDSQYAVQANVFKDDGLYKMYYKTYDDNCDTYIMHATSTDGYSWTKYGVVMDVMPGYDNFQCPFVMKNDNGTYTMLYDSSQSGSCRIYEAFSIDGIIWQQQGLELDVGAPGSLDEPMIFAPYVLKDTSTGTDKLYYSGYDGAYRRIFLATRQSSVNITPPPPPPPPPPPLMPPVADAGPDQTTDIDVCIDFNGSASYDPDGTIISYTWDFGDGTVGYGASTSHIYSASGTYIVILTVTDNDGLICIDSTSITVSAPDPDPVPDPIGAALIIDKVKTSGPDIVETHTKNGWILMITVSNTGDSDALDVVVHDVLPAELELVDHSISKGTFSYEQNGGGKAGSTSLTWSLGNLAPGEICQLELVISTKLNPAGKQEFTSPGTYSLNDGAWVTGIDQITGEGLLDGPTSKITVIAIDGNDEEEDVATPIYSSEAPLVPYLVLISPTGPGNIESETEQLSPTSSKILNSPSSLFIIVFLGFLLMMSPILLLERKKTAASKPAEVDLDKQLINGEITEEEYLRELKDME